MSAPLDTPPFLGSLANTELCGLGCYGDGDYTAEGITKLCEALKGSAVTWLKCAATPDCSKTVRLSVSSLYDNLALRRTIPAPTLARSLGDNQIGVDGASALAAVLKETQITNLECAAAPELSLTFSVSAP